MESNISQPLNELADDYNYNDTLLSTLNVTDFTQEDYRKYRKLPSPRTVPEAPGYLVTLITVLYMLIFIAGILGNIIVVIVVGCRKNMRTTVNIYIVNLCIADFLVLIVCMPPVLVELHVKEIWYFGEVMCKIVPFLEVVVASASVFTIIAISVERFRVVYKPLSIKNNNLPYVVKSIIFIWITGILLSIPLLFIVVYKDSMLKDGTPIKVCRMPVKYDWQRSYLVLVSCLNYFIPCSVLSILYFLLCRKLVRKPNVPLDTHDNNYRERGRLRKQVMQIIWTIVCVFFICHLPYRIVSLWWIFADKMEIASLGLETNLLILYFARLFLYINHALNPILYNFVSTKFRHSCMYIIFSSSRRKSSTRTNDRRLNKFSEISKHNNVPNVMLKNGNCKENVCLVRVEDDFRSSSSAGRERINDFSPLYIKQIADKNSDGDHLFDFEDCRFQIKMSKERTPFTEDVTVGHHKSDVTAVKLVVDADGYVVAVKLNNAKFKCRKDKIAI